MSAGEDINDSYYSAILARSLKQDDKKFDGLYNLISQIASRGRANDAREKAQTFAKLPLVTINHKISWLEKLGVKSLLFRTMDDKVEKSDDATLDQMLLELENASANKFIFPSDSDANCSNQKPAEFSGSLLESQVTHFIDSDDVEEIKSEPRLSPLPEPSLIQSDASLVKIEDAKPLTQCTIEMDEFPMNDDKYLNNYNSSTKTYYTAEDHENEQFHKVNQLPCPSFSDGISKNSVNHPSSNNVAASEESKKNMKKKKKAKAKAEVLENSAVYHPSIYDNQCRSFGGYSETQPLLGNDSNNYNYTTMKSLKARKLTRKTSVASESKRLEEKGDMSKAVNRQQVEQKKLSDKQMQEILEQLGDPPKEFVETKKKSKDNKHNLTKKDKKKLKKPKKGEKKKKPEPEERSDTEESDVPPKPTTTESTSDVFAASPVEENEEEFVMQRRKKTPHKHPSSGRTSPHKFEATRKRRYSDPSPGSPDDSTSRITGNNQASNKHEKPKSEYKRWGQVETRAESQNQLYDVTNVQWPTLTSQTETSSQRTVAASQVDSYASKLKTNLDSRGCSVASSSEDSSSSSSSNSYQGRSGDRSSPVHNYITTLSGLSRTIHAAAGIVKIDPNLRDQASVEELNASSQASKATGNVSSAKNGEKMKSATPCTVGTAKQSSNKNTVSKTKSLLPTGVTVSEANSAVAQSNKKENTSPSSVTPSLNTQSDKILNELSNTLGLSFFMDELSFFCDDLPEQVHDSAKLNSSNMQVTFGDGDLNLDQMTEVDVGGEPSSSNTVRIPSLNVDIVFNANLTNWITQTGDFDLKKATSTLMQEWKKARDKGTFYKDLNQ